MSDEIKNPNTEDEEYQPDLMTLEDEDGNEVTFEVIDALDHKGVHYLAVVEYTENEEDAEDAQLVILSVGEDDEGEYLDVVEDDETLLEVSKLFEQRLSDDYRLIVFLPQITRQDFLPGSICCGLYDPTNHSTGARSSPVECRPPRHGSTMEAR